MDPALRERLDAMAPGDELEAVIRLSDAAASPPPAVRVIARFGSIATCRIARKFVESVHDSEVVVSLKAAKRQGRGAWTWNMFEPLPEVE